MATGGIEGGSSGISDALRGSEKERRVEKDVSRTEGHLPPVSLSLPLPCLSPSVSLPQPLRFSL